MKATFIDRRKAYGEWRKATQSILSRAPPFALRPSPFPCFWQVKLLPQPLSVLIQLRRQPQRWLVPLDAQGRGDKGESSGLAHELQGACGLVLQGLERAAKRARRDPSRGEPGQPGGPASRP